MVGRLLRRCLVSAAMACLAVVLLQLSTLGARLAPERVVFDLASLPFIMLGLTAFLGLRIRQKRSVGLVIVIAMAYAILSGAELGPFRIKTGFEREVLLLAGLSSALVLSLGPQTLTFGPVGLLGLVLGVLPALLLYRYGPPAPISGLELLQDPLRAGVLELCVLLLAANLLLLYRRRDPLGATFDLGFLVAMGPVIVAAHGSGGTARVAIGFGAASAILLYAMFDLYWQRVYTDELTGLPNRRALDEYLRTLGRRYAIAMVDVDHFKRFNDRYGHDEGDNALRLVARVLAGSSRGRVFRYGGEEFAVVYRNTPVGAAAERLEGARAKLVAREFWIRAVKTARRRGSKKDRGRTSITGRTQVKITASFGVAERNGRTQPTAVLKQADRALYQAKKRGRNRVETA